MNIIRRIGVTGLLAMAALNTWAAPGGTAPTAAKKFDVSGTWNAKSEGGRGPATNLVLVLKQEGDKLTGTVSSNGAPPVEISEARVLRSSIYFEVTMAMPPRPAGPPGGPGGAMGGPPGGGGRQGGGPPGMGGGGMPGMGMGMGPMTTRYTATVSGDELKLTGQMKVQARDGDAPSGTGMPKTEFVGKRQ